VLAVSPFHQDIVHYTATDVESDEESSHATPAQPPTAPSKEATSPAAGDDDCTGADVKASKHSKQRQRSKFAPKDNH
jgi:hypothetical protein